MSDTSEILHVNVLGKTFPVTIEYDSNADSPRNWDNLGTIVYAHRQYVLGDEELNSNCDGLDDALALHVYENIQNESYSDDYLDQYSYCVLNEKGFERTQKWMKSNLIVLPVYLYDHSGISISTSSFGCKWDSGQAGYIFCTKEKAREYLNVRSLTSNRIEQIQEVLKNEITTYDLFLQGEVYCYSVDDQYVGGFIGTNHEENGLIHSIRSDLLYTVKSKMSVHYAQLKKYIKHHVPLQIRQGLSL